MKKTTITMLILCLAFSLIGFKFFEGTYTKNGVVTSVVKPCKEYKDGLVVFIDNTGRKFTFEGSEDWLVNDLCQATISDNGTIELLSDDYVVKDIKGNAKVIYTGYIPENLCGKIDKSIFLQ